MEIAIISDTHMPKGWRRLPERCLDRLRAADLIVHAGDLSTLEVLQELQSYGRVVAVHGNVDDAAVRAALPETAVVEAGGARMALIHDAGASRGRLERLRRRFAGSGAGAEAVVFGHSHIPLHEQAADGFQIFNPGSPTERRRAPRHTMGICRAAGGRLTFELVDLD
ncbi:MAG TPA: metallophosphoesterase family protein [Solirubrobacteraceae bacterium]|nr:metallophosphoesterase family protein [Solirubrobacteraceae bacterium]